jgi:hypothetical protein
MVQHFSVMFEHKPFIRLGTWECFVEATSVFTDRYTECLEALHTGSMEDLQ